MALITCPECGGKVSDTCDACIHCGYKLRGIKKVSTIIEQEPPKEIVINRGSAGGMIAVAILDIALGLVLYILGMWLLLALGLSDAVFKFLWIMFGVVFIGVGLYGVIAGVIGFMRIGQNANNTNPCVTYNTETNLMTFYPLAKGSFSLPPNAVQTFKCGMSTDYMLVIYLKNISGGKRKVRLGFIQNAPEALGKLTNIIAK